MQEQQFKGCSWQWSVTLLKKDFQSTMLGFLVDGYILLWLTYGLNDFHPDVVKANLQLRVLVLGFDAYILLGLTIGLLYLRSHFVCVCVG